MKVLLPKFSIGLCLANVIILSAVITDQFLTVKAAHAARRVTRVSPSNTYSNHPTKYDRSITTFSNDGRLLQVEYGMEASNQGQAVACMEIDWKSADGRYKVSAVCVAVVVEESNDIDEDDSSSEQDSEKIQNRMKVENTFISAEKVHRIDDHCLLITTGLIGDGRAVAQNARLSCQRLRLTYGETPTMTEISDQMSEIQHQLTRAAGARPLGVTTTFVGVDPYPEDMAFHHSLTFKENKQENLDEERHLKGKEEDDDADDNDELDSFSGKPRLFQSEPGGIVEEYEACAAGKGRRYLESKLVELRKSLIKKANDLVVQYENENVGGDVHNSASTAIKSQIIGEMMQSVAKTIFGTDDAKAQSIDLWLVESDLEYRGNARIRCAKQVREADLDIVAKRFM